MDVLRISVLFACLYCTITITYCDDDQHDVIQYLKRIESRLTRLEERWVEKESRDSVDKELNGINKQEKDVGRQKRESPMEREKLRKIPEKLSNLSKDAQCFSKTFNKISSRFNEVLRKLKKANSALSSLDAKHMAPLHLKIGELQESLMDVINSDVYKPGFVMMKVVSGDKLINISCRKMTEMTEDLHKDCETIISNGGEVAEALKCCQPTDLRGESTCKPIEVPLCKDISYSLTSFPNMFSHRSQSDAIMEIHHFYPLVKVQCSKDLKLFLCSMYTPVCLDMESNDHVMPCRSFCERARDGCAPLMRKFGFPWPKKFECDNFPDMGQICLNRNVPVGSNTNVMTGDLASASIPDTVQCQRIGVTQCSDVGYSHTFMPNLQNQISQEEAYESIETFLPLVKLNCSPELLFLVCNVYTPMCAAGTYIPVCRSVCDRVQNGCEKALKDFGFDWPTSLDCARLPVQSKTVLCLDRNSIPKQ